MAEYPNETPQEREARKLREAQAAKGAAGNVAGGALGGALSGAGTGAMLGPAGAAVGGIIGGFGGLIGGANKQAQAGAPSPSTAASANLSPVPSKPGSIMDQTKASTAPGQAMVGRVTPGQAPPPPPAVSGQQAPTPPPAAATPPRQPVNGLLASLGKIPGAIGGNIKQNPIAAVGLANDIGQTIGDLGQNASERRNAGQIAKLESKERGGQMGLDPRERSAMNASLMNPVRAGITQLGNSLSGASGQVSPAQMASMRRDASSTIADAAQGAAGQINLADIDAERGNRAELEQRIATKAAGDEQNRSNLGERLGSIVESEGMRAGGPPLDIMGPYGEPIRDEGQARRVMTDLGLTPEEVEQVIGLGPEAMTILFRELQPQSPPMGG